MKRIKNLVVMFAMVCMFGMLFMPTKVMAAGSTKEEATQIKAGELVTDSISVADEQDWYRIKSMDYTNYYTIKVNWEPTQSNSSFYLYVIDEDMERVATVDLPGWTTSGIKNVKLAPGKTYYVKVTATVPCTAYTFNLVGHLDIADKKEEAEFINNDTLIEESIIVPEDEDWYKIKAVDYTNYYTIKANWEPVQSNSDFFISIIDENMTNVKTVHMYGGDSSATENVKLVPGKIYYIKVYATTPCTSYSFKLEVHHDEADNADTAETISTNVSQRGSICVDNEADYWKYVSSATGEVKFTLTNVNMYYDPELYLYDADGNPVELDYWDKTANLELGRTYYVKVTGSRTGEYSFFIENKSVIIGWMFSSDRGKSYWFEEGLKQGTYDDPNGVIGDGTVRGREIYDPSSDGWYWLDACYEGAKACNKEVWMPYIYQNEDEWEYEEIAMNAANSGDMANQVIAAIQNKEGKWVRYDANGKMYKGWYKVEGEDAALYPSQAGNTYYYDYQTGLMAKGYVNINGTTYHFDETTGALIQ